MRKNIRLKEYDYSSNGAYFVTICSDSRKKIFWTKLEVELSKNLMLDELPLSELGQIAKDTIRVIENRFGISIDNYVIMPDHIHMLVSINSRLEADQTKGDISTIVGVYKSLVTNRWLKICKDRHIQMGNIWQRSYYDHIIRNKQDYSETWKYIDKNPYKYLT